VSTLWLVTSRRCNLACGYCYQAQTDENPHVGPLFPGTTGFMTDEVTDLGMKWAERWQGGAGTNRPPLSVILYGGEPLLSWPLIQRIVSQWNLYFAERHRSIRWSITTNGVLLEEDKRAFLDRYDISVLLSLDGPKRLHDTTRKRHDGRGSWDQIKPEELVKWRPTIEVTWQLDPSTPVAPADVDELRAHGFRNINFNLNWLVHWDAEARSWLTLLFRHVGRLAIRGEIGSNWMSKLDRAITTDAKMEQPCGTGTGMLALTPEGFLYPSQEMAFTVFEPWRAKGTAEWYRVGDVRKSPVIDPVALQRVSGIKTSELKVQAPGYACDNCIAKSDCIGGCHCRYVGQITDDPGYRFNIPAGYCESNVAAHTGMLQAAQIERWVRPVKWLEKRQLPMVKPEPPTQNVSSRGPGFAGIGWS